MAVETYPAPAPDTAPPVEDVIHFIERLSPPDRLRVLEAASRLVHEDVVTQAAPQPAAPPVNDTDTDESYDEWLKVRAQILADVPPDSPLHRMLGAFRKRGVRVPMTREEERDLITEAIMEKHLR